MIRKKLLLSLLSIVTLLISCNSKKKEEVDEAGKFLVTSPILLDTSFNKEYVAQIQSLQNIEIRAKVKGYIETINADEGQRVKKGQLLFTIRPRQYEAELMKAKAEARTAELEMMNVKKLAEKNIVSQSELSMAIAKLDQAKAEVALAELEYSYTQVTAPFDGILDRIQFKTGSLIDEGTLLTTLSNNSEVYAYFNVSEVEYLDFKSRNEGSEMNNLTLLLANGQAHKYKGRIQNIEGQFDNETGNIAFRAKFPNPDYLLKHGETGKVQLKIPLKNCLIIPQKATYEIQDKIYVYVLDKSNRLKSKNVVIKQRLQNLYVIEKGLDVNDKILLEGVQNVSEDQKVETEYLSPIQVINNLQLIKQ